MDILYQNVNGDLLKDEFQPLLKNGGKIAVHNSTRYINVDSLEDSNKKTLPELYTRKELCCGCSACFSVCPKSDEIPKGKIHYRFLKSSERECVFDYTGAISMLPDEEGFIYPVVDAKQCIKCYKCLKVCPYK